MNYIKMTTNKMDILVFVVILLNVVLLNAILALYGSSFTLPLSIRTFSTNGLIVTLSIIDAQHNNIVSSDIMLSIIMLNVVMLSVIMLSVVAPIFTLRQKSL
jgi:hypothetical protein